MKIPSPILAFALLIEVGLSSSYAQINTVYGKYAGNKGSRNTHIGNSAGKASVGTFNTFIGHQSGNSNSTGNHNAFLGYLSGYKNSTGNYNTFLGDESGRSNTSGSDNTFLGYFSGYNSSTGVENTFLGAFSGRTNRTGSYNTFMGTDSGKNNTYGHYNTFLGHSSGFSNINGSYNTFLGFFSGYSNTTGAENTFLGYLSGGYNATGSYNTFLGHFSGWSNTSGDRNVFIGYRAGYSESASNRLYIDNNDDNQPLLYGNFYYNVVSIGTKYTGSAYKLVVPGRVRVNALDVVSDERVKKDIHPLQDVLTKVLKVEGISYTLKEEVTEVPEESAGKTNERTKKAGESVMYGFRAQNIREVFPELVTEDEGLLAVNYQGMIPVLVEAIKSLTEEREHVAQMQAQIVQLQQALATLNQSICDATSPPVLEDISGTQLHQNHPNPFDQRTTIRYEVGNEARQVSLLITSLHGTGVQQYDNLPTGQGEVAIAAGSLGAGTYVYTLVVDGKPVASKKMLLLH